MKRLQEAGPNAEQIRYWNDEAGPKWVDLVDRLDALIQPLGSLALERAAVRPGETVLDVGCGCGQTSLQLAERVGPEGRVTGIDLSAPMLETAERRARQRGLANLHFQVADAQTAALDWVDLIFSRFGVMFFADPLAAFANLRRHLHPGGRVVFVCWQELPRNPWMLEPLMAVGKHLSLPAPPAPDEPGPFAFSDPERVRGILGEAGFDRLEIEGAESQVTLDGQVGEAAEFLLRIGPAAAALREADEDVRRLAAAAVREVLLPHAGPGGVRMDCAVWLVTAA